MKIRGFWMKKKNCLPTVWWPSYTCLSSIIRLSTSVDGIEGNNVPAPAITFLLLQFSVDAWISVPGCCLTVNRNQTNWHQSIKQNKPSRAAASRAAAAAAEMLDLCYFCNEATWQPPGLWSPLWSRVSCVRYAEERGVEMLFFVSFAKWRVCFGWNLWPVLIRLPYI